MKRTLSVFALLVLIHPLIVLAGETRRGPLADYLAQPDDSYRWTVKQQGDLGAAAYAELILTSQTWKGLVWKHQVFVIKPALLQADTSHALLFITGGSWRDSLETSSGETGLSGEARLLANMAEVLKTPVVVVRQVPRQPIFDGKYEDAIIAFTFEQYLKTGDVQWPLLLPMVKSAVRAMDAAQEFTRREWSLDIKTFTVTGASKRGWTTWLTSAHDPRVTALAPMVIDMLNMTPQLEHQEAVWGEPSHQIRDYTERGLHKILRTKKGEALQRIVDPYQYRRQLPQPKLVLLGTNDAYWPLDALNLYWSDLLGEKYILYVPNNGHGLKDYGRVFGSLNALHQQAARGYELPKLSWQFQRQDGRLQLILRSKPAADKVLAWTANAPTRDFRPAEWRSSPAETDGEESVIHLAVPEDGFSAVFGEAQYTLDGTPYYFSTNVRIVSAAP
jgi:PhoPQ-activated pathogenicity-related protein